VHDAFRDGSLIGSSSTTGSYATGDPEHAFRVGGNLGGNGQYYDGAIGEILVYDVRHDDTTRGEVESYLADKWGITI
jgi:hypothetical protein